MRNEIVKALELIGNFSKPSKMPCQSWSIPAKKCKTGMKLRNVEGSVCSKCYALKGRYPFPNVQKALEKRFESLSNPFWEDAMVLAISETESSGFFRWHDSGDLQSVEHLEKIANIAKRLPSIRFWLPTREYSFVAEFVKRHGNFPENLTVRLSSLMIEGKPPVTIASRFNLTTSGVSKEGFNCPSSKQDGKCLTCRACWDQTVKNVNYKIH